MRRLICVLAVAGSAVGAGRVQGSVTVTPLVLAGDPYAGSAVSTGFASVSRLEINNNGTWLIHSTLTGAIDVLITGTGTTLPGTIIATDGDTVASGGNLSFFGRLSINNAGTNSFYATYVNAGTADSGIHYNTTTQAIVEQSIATAPEFAANTRYIGFFGGLVNDTDQILVLASVDDPAIASTVDRAFVLVNNPGGAATQTALLKEGDEVAPGRLVVDFQTNPHTYDLAAGGRAMLIPDLDGDGLTDSGLLFYNGTSWSFAAREGDPCPAVPGRTWFNFGSSNACDINNSGAWAARAQLNTPTTDDLIIVRNGTDLIAREGSPVPALPAFNFAATGSTTAFGSGAVKIDDSGNVFYFAGWNDPDTTRNTGLFRNQELLVQKGVTTLPGGEIITDIAPVQDNFSISNNGRYLVFEGDVTDVNSFVRRGTILVQISGCRADFNGSGAVTVQDIFDFLAAYFANAPGADFNGQGGVTVQDIFDFLAAYFTPCT